MVKYLLGSLLFIPSLAFAQAAEATGGEPAVFSGPQFFGELVLGFILAMAFQMLLTNLSIAAGVSAAGNAFSSKEKRASEGPAHHEEKDAEMSTARKIGTAYGVWTFVTTALALFAACWLAVKFALTTNMTTNAWIGVGLGLGIWGLFYLAVTTLQASALSSLAGSLTHAAGAGLRSLKDTAAALMKTSPEEKAADTAGKVAAAVREEFFGDAGDFRKQAQRFFQELKPQPVNIREIREELTKLFNDMEIRAMTVREDYLDREKLVASLHTKYGSPERAKEMMGQAKGALSAVKEEAQAPGKSPAEKAVDAGLRLAGLSQADAEKIRQKWEGYLRSTGKQELNPESIKREVENLFSNPAAAKEALKTRAAEVFNKSTITTLLSQRKDMSKEEAEQTVNRIDTVIQEIRQRAESARKSIDDLQSGAVARVRDYLNALNRPELKYEGLKEDVSLLFHDPKGGFESLARRLNAMDRETVKSLLASRKDVTPEDAEHIVSRFENMRDELAHKTQAMKMEFERRIQQAKEETLRQAEEARKTVATAAWWAFITAVGSGIAAVGGSLAALR
jgi:hypothetical protein